MRHTKQEVIERVKREYELLDSLLSGLPESAWSLPLQHAEGKDPWTVKDAAAHITFWKYHAARGMRNEKRPPEERGLKLNELNHLIYMRWKDRPPREVYNWHRQVQEEALATLQAKPDAWFSGKERNDPWPADLENHSVFHREKIERVVKEAHP